MEKLLEYAAVGVRFYGIVDPVARTLEIHELGQDGRYTHALSAADGVLRATPGCEGLVIDLDGLWAAVDRLEREDES